MLRGGFEHQVDDKGRIIIPVRFREFLSPACFITRGLHNCLFVFPWTVWVEIEKNLNATSIIDEDALALQRFFGTGIEASLDGQGRLILPATLREYAGIQKDIFVLGAISHLELWAKSRWTEYESKELSTAGILQKAKNLGVKLQVSPGEIA
jgi:MraZ protein